VIGPWKRPLRELALVSPFLHRSRSNSNGLRELVRYATGPVRNRLRPRFPRVEAERVLGLASTGHGASITYLDASGVVRSSQLERWTGTKHMMLFSREEDEALRQPSSTIDQTINFIFTQGYGRFPDSRIFEDTIDSWRDWLLAELDVPVEGVDLVVTSDGHFCTGWARLGPHLQRWFPNAAIVRAIEHHEIHQRQAFWASGFDEAAVLTLDTAGEALPRRGWRQLAGTISVMNRDGKARVLREWLFPEMSSGTLFDATTHHVGFRQGDEGKTMGLSAYGSAELFETLRPHLTLHDDGGFSFLSRADFQASLDGYTPARAPDEEITQRHMDVAFAGQAILELIVANAWRAALELTGQTRLAYAGGVALNSVANGRAWDEVRPESVYIPPNPGDPGHSLGCALFGAYEVARWEPPAKELPEYLGPPYSEDAIATVVRANGHPCVRPADVDETIAACIANGHIVARFDGGAEFGPRALGNRSILADPRRPGMKDYLNLRVKHRESFRPFAPAVLEDQAGDWFELDGPSPYMLRVVSIQPEKVEQIPAVAHVDGTARVQTLSERQNPGFWRVISAFRDRTGLPLVLNTSFNLAGKPIVETPADAAKCFSESEIDVLAVGPFVLSKQPLESYLANDSGA
jgi:carbamoyltransferase